MMKHLKKNEKNMINNYKKMKKTRGKLQFSIFIFFAPLEAKMMKNDKKNDKQMKKTRGKLQFSIFCRIFAPLEAKMMKNDKAMI